MIKYGMCTKCRKWGIAPDSFRESKHFLKCECGAPMYLSIFNPIEAGYREKEKITPGTINHGVKLDD